MRVPEVLPGPIGRGLAVALALIPAAFCAEGFLLEVQTLQKANTDSPVQFSQSGTYAPLSLHPPTLNGVCDIDGTYPVSASASGDADIGNVFASAATTGEHCSVAWTITSYTNTFTLHPPAGASNSGVSFSVSTAFDISLNLPPPRDGQTRGFAYVFHEVPEFDTQTNAYRETSGTFSGTVGPDQFRFDHCPCVFTLKVYASASVLWGGTGSARGISTLNLPPGWTYTTAAQDTSLAGARFVPLTPCRIADTRNASGPFGGPVLAANSSRTFPVTSSACGIPSGARAYSLNVTVVPREPLGYLTLWPTGRDQPFASTLNSPGGSVVANAALVPAGEQGSVDVFVTNTTDVILDINGYFAGTATTDGLLFYPVTPCRIVDTRNPAGAFGGPTMPAGGARIFNVPSSTCNVPSSARAYSLNATVVPRGRLGYLSLWPTGGSQPLVSTLNSPDGIIVANAAMVPAGTGGAISAYVSDATDLILDINGYFAPPQGTGGLLFYALSPCRVSDTRNSNGPFGGPVLEGGAIRSFAIPSAACGIPATAQAYSLNATVVPAAAGLGYLTLWPTGRAQPYVSTLNSPRGLVVANAAIVPAGDGGAVSAFATDRTHLILDVNGFFAP